MRRDLHPSYIRLNDGQWDWVPHSLARQQFTAPQIEEYAMETRSGRDGYGENSDNNNTTTNSIHFTVKNTIILCS
jgi:hypothetical protein